MIKYLVYIISVVTILSSSQATFIDVGTFADSQNPTTNITIAAGQTVNLFTQITTDEAIAGVEFDVIVPTAGWFLDSRNYDQHGWHVEDGIFDDSSPKPSNIPLEITSNLDQLDREFPITPSPVFDFHFASSVFDQLDDGPQPTNTGTFVIEDFEITVPETLQPGFYPIVIDQFQAFDTGGNPLHQTSDVTIDPFGINISAVIPEPSTKVLFSLLALGVFLISKSRITTPSK